jgi:hypothetical protein
MKSRWLLLLAALSATVAFLTAACSDSVPPLGDGGEKAVWCAPGSKGVTITMGVYSLRNSSASPVTIQSVKLPVLVRLRMTRAYLVPIPDRTLIGEGYWPPKQEVWALRRSAVGGVIRPGQALNLVFGLTMITDRGGYSSGPLITYTDAGNTSTVQEMTALTVGQHGACNLPPGVT